MTEREADSVRHLLSSQILFGRKQLARQRGRAIGLVRDDEDGNGTSEWEIRNEQMEEALADLCALFGMNYPLWPGGRTAAVFRGPLFFRCRV